MVRFAAEAIAAGRYRNLDEGLALLVRVMAVATVEAARRIAGRMCADGLLKQFRMCAGADKDHGARFAAFIKPVNQQEIAADMAFPVPVPVSQQRVVPPLRAQRLIIGDQ